VISVCLGQGLGGNMCFNFVIYLNVFYAAMSMPFA
jgi:hypothetical protein